MMPDSVPPHLANITAAPPEPAPVRLSAIDISFGDLFFFMLKLWFASFFAGLVIGIPLLLLWRAMNPVGP